jgi:Ca-activated chloride channel family protein
MIRMLGALALAAASAAAAIALDGPDPLGRLALRAGMPELAAPLLRDPLWKGIALYRAGAYDAAVAELRRAGPSGYFDRGNALARAGRFPEAVEVYDAALYDEPLDADARANRALVLALIDVVGEAQAAPGRSEPDGGFVEPAGLIVGEAPDTEAYKSNTRRRFEDQYMAATPQWLATLPDEPGQFLRLRLAEESRRRFESGTGLPPPEDPR